MDFSYSQEQRMLTDSLRRLMADRWTYADRRTRQKAGVLDQSAWANLAELGVSGLLVPEEFGGFGESPATMLAVHHELGRGLVSEPVISSAVMAVTLLANCSNQALKERWLTAHAEGEAVLAVAWQEEGERYATRPLCTRAIATSDGFTLDGRKVLVWHAAGSQALIVSAVLDGEMALFLVPADALGVGVADYPTFDGSRASTVTFERVTLASESLIAQGAQAQSLLVLALDFGIAALCAHACGAMEYLTEATIQYLKTRKQFGQPLAAFQVLQHRLADMLTQQEMGISSTYVATVSLAESDAAKRSRVISMAKVEVCAAARFVGESAVQLHGGMGMTDELEVGDYFKRLTFADMLLGDTNFHLQRAQDLGN
ncbi:MAG: acyl-CoA dehydrogenase family protein [Sheuella sp.]|nr:acyl-CoA dehydrogenase family protein [Sheuella sp.]